LIYNYYISKSIVDYEKGTVFFNKRFDSPVVLTISNYIYQSCDMKTGNTTCNVPCRYFKGKQSGIEIDLPLNSFAFSQDDLVDYLDPNVTVNPFGI
jgi:hypothetical protein